MEVKFICGLVFIFTIIIPVSLVVIVVRMLLKEIFTFKYVGEHAFIKDVLSYKKSTSK